MARGRAQTRGGLKLRPPDPAPVLSALGYADWNQCLAELADDQVVVIPASASERRLGPSPVIAVDLDSTIFPLLAAIRDVTGDAEIDYPGVPTWEWLVDRLGGLEPALEVFDQAMGFEASHPHPPFEGAAETIRRLGDEHNARVVIMTDRSPANAPEAARYLEHHGIPHSGLVCGRLADKVGLCFWLDASVIIDDRPSTLEAAADAGLLAATIAHPYTDEVCATTEARAHSDWNGIHQEILRHISA